MQFLSSGISVSAMCLYLRSAAEMSERVSSDSRLGMGAMYSSVDAVEVEANGEERQHWCIPRSRAGRPVRPISHLEMDDHLPPFLSNVLRHNADSPPTHRPHVTLTFAQSLDAKIAGMGGRQIVLSGKDSMVMTHW